MDQFKFNPGQAKAWSLLGGPQRHTCLVGGARAGKTFLIVRAQLALAGMFPNSRHGMFRFRGNSARASIALDTLPKVNRLCFPQIHLTPHKQEGYYSLPNGSELWIMGLDDQERVDKILGMEFASMFFNECSQISYLSVTTALTRLAQVCYDGNGRKLKQRAFYDLNPTGLGHWTNQLFGKKLKPDTREPVIDPHNYERHFINPVDNVANLTPEYLQMLEAMPEKQRKRFYEGLYVSDVDGALWTYERLEQCRIVESECPTAFSKIVIAVDPSGARGPEDKRSDEIGIIVAGLGLDGRAYILADLSCREGPGTWGKLVADAFIGWKADFVVAEMNYGRAMVEETIRRFNPMIPIREAHASRGKQVRAEPVAALYDPRIDKVRHVGRFAKLEDQLCEFSTAGYTGERSPDRADAMIWALHYLMVTPKEMGFKAI